MTSTTYTASANQHEKLRNLENYLTNLENLAIAFSGGVDSTFLLAVAHKVLDDKVLAITAHCSTLSTSEKGEPERFCAENCIECIAFDSREMDIPQFVENPPDRCYVCKKAIFGDIIAIAHEHGMENIAEGSNKSDEGDYRPGFKAIAELGVISPLRACNLTKNDIRALSREMNLPTWNKPSLACLASRFPYGERITPEAIRMVDEAEAFLRSFGIGNVRVRIIGNEARIEVPPASFPEILKTETREAIISALKEIGFVYISLDLAGFRSGSMNEALGADMRTNQ